MKRVTKEVITNFLNGIGASSREYMLYSGTALVMLGIKEDTEDLDIGATEPMFNYLLNYSTTEITAAPITGVKSFKIEQEDAYTIEVFLIDPPAHYTIVDGIVRVQPLTEIISWKKQRLEKKDTTDLELIKKKLRL